LSYQGLEERIQEERVPKLIMEWIPGERRKKEDVEKKNVDGRCTSNHENKTFRRKRRGKKKKRTSYEQP
jgi:hypothetical protein